MIRLLALAYLSLLLLGLSDNMRGPLYPEILREFSLSDTVGSLFFSLSSIFGFLGGLFAPRLIQRFRQVGTLRLTFVLCGLSQGGLALAPNFGTLLVAVFLFGFSLGVMGVIQNSLVVTQSPPHLRNRLLSGLHSMYALASLLAPLLVRQVAEWSSGGTIWRLCFQIGAACSLLVLLLSLGRLSADHTPQRVSLPAANEGSGSQYYFAVMLASYVLAEILVSTRLAQLMRQKYEADLSLSSLYTAGFFVALLAGRGLFSFWTPRWPLKMQLLFSLFMSALSIILGIAIHPFALMLSGFFMAPFYPLMMVEAGRLFHRDQLSQALAKCIALSCLFVVMMHVLVGWLTDHFGILFAFSLGPLFCGVSFVMLGLHEKVFYRLRS